jgi:penicillin-binding protein, 1A family
MTIPKPTKRKQPASKSSSSLLSKHPKKKTTSRQQARPRKPANQLKTRKRSAKKGALKPQSLKRRLAKWTLIGFIWSLLIAGLALYWFSYDLPSVTKLADTTRRPSITFLARDGTKFATVGDFYSQPVQADRLPPSLIQAFIATEDRRFFDHIGLDGFGLMRALLRNLIAGEVVQGGSTITQQLAKNFLLTQGLYHYSDRSLRRKIQEVLLSLWLEAKFTKQQILTIYLNRVYFGAGAFGIGAAAQQYFNKSPYHLTLHESAVLAGLLKAPSKYSPQHNPDLAAKRTRQVLMNMQEAGYISPTTCQELLQAPLPALALSQGNLFARYFIDWILDTLPQLIGAVTDDLVVTTTLDIKLQRQVELYTRAFIDQEGERSNVSQAAVLCMTPTGNVRALVGGANYATSQFNRATQASRQTGSIFKLFVYLAGLEAGLTPHHRLADTAVKIGGWAPKNYGWTAKGEVSLQDGFAYSINTVSARLAHLVGYKKVQGMARRLGITTPQPNNLTLALGAGEASLLEITTAYGCLAHNGYSPKPTGIIEIRTTKGQRLYRHTPPSPSLALKASTVASMKQLLQAVMTYGTGHKVAARQSGCYGKTGTSQNYKDAWFIGFTPELVTGVWMGNDDNSPMSKVTGAKLPGKLWQQIMQQALPSSP